MSDKLKNCDQLAILSPYSASCNFFYSCNIDKESCYKEVFEEQDEMNTNFAGLQFFDFTGMVQIIHVNKSVGLRPNNRRKLSAF